MFTFCEGAAAGSRSRWHIRQITEAGLKLDTPALCGYAVAWDLKVRITDFHLNHSTCRKCAAKYREEQGSG